MKVNLLQSLNRIGAGKSRLLLTVCLLAFATVSFGQNQIIQLPRQGSNSVSAIVNAIQKQTKLSVDYTSDVLKSDDQVRTEKQSVKLSDLLDELTRGRGLHYQVKGRHIIINRAAATAPAQQQPQAQTQTFTGTVRDANGEPIIGATVIEKGHSGNGVITDMDGKYTIHARPGAKLTISYVGSVPQDVTAGQNTDITLQEQNQNLDEVVVVGYGTQKKVDLTGSVASVDMEEMTKGRPVTNISNGLAGLAAGVSVTSTNNRPGGSASVVIRGQGTLNSYGALVIIDGVEQGISTVDPQDVESISILKDAASSAIYGSRAANGVILITTKRGKAGTVKVNYDGYVSFNSHHLTDKIQPVSNYADYMEYFNEAMTNGGEPATFSQEKIDEWRANPNDPLLHPNTNWIDALFRVGTATNHKISISGGGDKMRLYASLGYLGDPGIMDKTGWKKYNGRVNFDADVAKWFTTGAQLSGYVSDYDSGSGQVNQVFSYVGLTTPGMVFKAPDGRLGGTANPEDNAQSSVNNPYYNLYAQDTKTRQLGLYTRFYATIRPFKGFSITGSYNFSYWDQDASDKPNLISEYNFSTGEVVQTKGGRTYFSNGDSKDYHYYNDLIARYSTSLIDKNFNIDAMAGLSNEKFHSQNFSGLRYDLIDRTLDAINAATGDMSASGTQSEYSMRSFFGRLNLNWMEKYLFEFNLRADGSSRFAKNKRWGYFPSFSAGWRIDQENFMKGALGGQLDNLKLRVSYGSLGNNAVGNYAYQSLYALRNNSYSLNNAVANGLAINAIANSSLTWEKTKVFDVGVDFGFFRNRFTGTIDYFHKKTTGILISLPSPMVHGMSATPTTNAAEVSNKGVELTLGWQDQLSNGFKYGVTGNFTYVKNNVDKFKGKDAGGMSISGANLIWEGHSINSQYLLRVDRILQTDEDMKLVQQMIDNAPVGNDGKKVNPFAAFGTPEKGDFLYKDINGDGVIDNNDREIVSDGPNPKFYFGLTLSAEWKGFDFSMLLQGQAGIKTFWQNAVYNTPTVQYGAQINKRVAEGAWREGRTDAKFPRLLSWENKKINIQNSDFYLEDRSYVKIRNIQLGYTLPKNISKYIYLERLRVYCTLENFFTFTSFRGMDPEVNGENYPTTKQVTLGMNITF